MPKSAWAFVNEVWQVLLWMAGLGFVIMTIGHTLQSFLALPLGIKLFVWFTVAMIYPPAGESNVMLCKRISKAIDARSRA
jgi:hypothetical protein